jgi:inorganic triphosphatase YgiF
VALYQLALALHAAAPLTVMKESKAERGYRLRSRRPPAALKASDVALDSGTSTAETFRLLLASGLSHLLVNRAVALSGDAEGIHQMRVAIRQLRAVLILLEPHLEPHATSRFVAELRRIGQVFNEARDWDACKSSRGH